MSTTDIFSILQWWTILFLVGISALPLTFFIFKNFFDKGYLFAKIIGLTFTTYFIFIFGLFHIIPFTFLGSLFILILSGGGFFLLFRKKQSINLLVKNHWKIFLGEELLFLMALFFWSYIHAFSPDVHGLEKYMDFGFINSILRTDYFPPKDMWFTPHYINYYYFGHLMTAILTKLSGLPSGTTFNLMLSTIFAFCFTQAFSIATNLYTFLIQPDRIYHLKRIIAGLLSASLVTFSGNLHVLYAFFKAYPNESPVPLWQLPFLPFSFPNAYWYPNATRFIHNTIHEFPMYSWTVADLHGHVLDIPLVLLTIAVFLAIFINAKSQNSPLHQPKRIRVQTVKQLDLSFWSLLLIGFLLAVMYMTNAWDGAIYFLLSLLILTAFYWNHQKKKILFAAGIIFLGFIIFITPYNLNFKPFASGIGILCSPDFLVAQQKIGPFIFEADHCQHSPWWQLLTLYGFFLVFIISFLVFLMRTKKFFVSDQFVLLLTLLGMILIMIPEFIYLKDIYPAHYRANTMFKLVFQAFILLSFVSGYILVRLVSSIRRQSLAILVIIPFTGLVALVLLYPSQAINSYYGNLQTYRGLDGTAYLKNLYPTDAEAIVWLNTNVKNQPVILEAQGDSYTDFARISTNTGLPTVLGWTVHEWLWRGSYDIPSPRINDIKLMYESTDFDEAKQLFKKYNISYVFVGDLEYQKYPTLQEKTLRRLGKVVFEKGTTKIYQITKN